MSGGTTRLRRRWRASTRVARWREEATWRFRFENAEIAVGATCAESLCDRASNGPAVGEGPAGDLSVIVTTAAGAAAGAGLAMGRRLGQLLGLGGKCCRLLYEPRLFVHQLCLSLGERPGFPAQLGRLGLQLGPLLDKSGLLRGELGERRRRRPARHRNCDCPRPRIRDRYRLYDLGPATRMRHDPDKLLAGAAKRTLERVRLGYEHPYLRRVLARGC